jgi:hypothetical protein
VPLRIFARLRRATYLLALLALATTLVPARPASAALPIIDLTEREGKEVFYRHYIKSQVAKDAVVETTLITHLIYNADLRQAASPESEVKAMIEHYHKLLGPRGADSAYRASLPSNTRARALYTAALQTPLFKKVVPETHRELQRKLVEDVPIMGLTGTRLAAYLALSDERILSQAYGNLLDDNIEQAYQRAQTDKQFAQAWNTNIRPEDRSINPFAIDDFDTQEYLKQYPEGVPEAVLRAARPDGSLEISLADLQKLAQEEFGKINASIDDMQQTLGTISAQQGELVEYMQNQELLQKHRAMVEAKAREHQLKLQAANASVYLLSTLVGFADEQAGRQLATVGGAVIQLAEAYNGWMHAVAGLNNLDKLTSLSTIVFAGSAVGSVMSVVSLFGGGQPTPEQMILQEIGKLRQQVSELRVEMHERFDRVDAQLNAIYATLQERFNQIDVQLGKINGSLQELQQSLVTLGLALDRLERNNFEYLDAVGRRPLAEAVNGALDYKRRTGLDMPYQPEFVAYENSFHTWATVNAFDALSAGPTQRNYADAAVLGELSSAPLDANLNYLNGWLVAKGLPPFANKRLAGLRDWTFASRAYAEMGFEWPQHLGRIDGTRQESLDAVGADLEAALRAISTIQTADGPKANTPLFTGVISYYSAKLDALDRALLAKETAYVAEVQASLKRSTPFDLFGGLDQTVAHQVGDFSTIGCGGTQQDGLATPSNLANVVPEYKRQLLADYLGTSKLSVCLAAEWANQRDECYPDPVDPRVEICDTFADARATLTVYSDDVPLLSRASLASGGNVEGKTPMDFIVGGWGSYKRDFEAQFGSTTAAAGASPTPAAAQQLSAVSDELERALADYQKTLYSRVLSDVNGGNLGTEAVELAGAKKLLDSFVSLGLPQASANDDLLRSLLYSEQSIVDDQQLIVAYATPLSATVGATQAISPAQLMTNPRVELHKQGQKRREALSGLLADYFKAIDAGTHREDSALVANARFDMLLARAFANPDQPLPDGPLPGQPGPGNPRPDQPQPTASSVFLPLLRR